MKRQENNKSNKILAVIVILLLVAIGVLLWLLFKPQPEPAKIPTGNVDIFNIRISCLCNGEDGNDEECDSDNTPGPEGHKGYSGSTINDETDTEIDDDGVVYVDDENGRYVYQRNLRIFQNAAFEYTDKIAPGVSNSYDFKVHNEPKNSIRYNVQFEEESEYPVNMKYRLRRGNEYLVGSETTWVSVGELTVAALKILSTDGVDTYTLDWKWPYEDGVDDADTNAGKNMTSEYNLGIKINFEEI